MENINSREVETETWKLSDLVQISITTCCKTFVSRFGYC